MVNHPQLPRKSNKDLLRILGHGLMIWGTVNQLFRNGQMLMENSGKRIGCRPWAIIETGIIETDRNWVGSTVVLHWFGTSHLETRAISPGDGGGMEG